MNQFFVKLNEHDNPGFVLFCEIVQKFWTSPQEEKDKARSWSEKKMKYHDRIFPELNFKNKESRRNENPLRLGELEDSRYIGFVKKS